MKMVSDDAPLPLFGYGSLILPTSLVGRFDEPDPPLNNSVPDSSQENIYDVRDIDGVNPLASEGVDEVYLRSSELEIWEKYKNQIQLSPAKISGFRRYYSNERPPEGAMLEAVRTGDPEDWINGVIINGLTQNQFTAVSESEKQLQKLTIDEEYIEYYENISPPDFDRIIIFASKSDISTIRSTRRRNYIYHNRILAGIILLGQYFGTDLAKQFYHDFRQTTYETPPDCSSARKFNIVSENE